jgi:D-alanyl-D-alanine carboxypeptidase (penicillin-binding protein 5/6)
MNPGARRLVALLTGMAAVAAMASLAAPSASAAPRAQPPSRLDVGGSQLAGTGVVVQYPPAGARRLPKVPASAYVIADAATGQILAAKDPHGLFPPASTLKVLTAITMIPLLNPNAEVDTSHQAASVQPNVVGLLKGRSYQVSSLFKALLLISANDAAVSLAQASGSFDRGVALMNAEAHRLQAYDVVAKQPNGLPAAGQHVSAYDEALIARQALSMPAFMGYDSLLTARFEIKPRKWVTLVNQNSLLTDYPGGIGGKIGWTSKAKATYIGLARRKGVTLIVAILHCAPLKEITSGERLLSWGFAMDGRVRPVGVLVPPLRTVAAARHGASPAAHHAPPVRPRPAPGPSVQPARSRGGRSLGFSHARRISADLAGSTAVVAAAVLGLGGLARSRRRAADTRR